MFDVRQFATLLGSSNPLTALGTTFGMPSCLLNLTSNLLSLFPTPALIYMSELSEEAAAKANEFFAEIVDTITFRTGIISFDTENGFLKFGSDSSLGGINSFFAGVGGIFAAMGAVAAAGGQLYTNVNTAISQVKEIIDCINSFLNGPGGAFSKSPTGGNSDYDALAAAEYERYRAQLELISNALQDIVNFQDALNEELNRRAQDPTREPTVIDPSLSSLGFAVPPDLLKPTELIRLVFGPPKSIEGQYLLSVDGLYYDSQGEDSFSPILLQLSDRSQLIEASNRWKFNFDPNLGGKGDQLSSKSFSKWIDTVFDLNIIDDGPQIQNHYKKDHFLQLLIGNKEKRILDLSSYINQLVTEQASEAIIQNFKESLLSEVAYHENKINRRKKQIEIAVKTNDIFGKRTNYLPGEVPINDFSYLEDCNISLALEQQKKLVLRQDEVSGVVLPLTPTFAVSKPKQGLTSQLDFLNVPQIGVGSVIVDSSGPSDASAAEISISDVVTTDGLFAIYNYLNSKIVDPSSTNFEVLNCISPNDYNNAQLVSESQSSVFRLGLGAVYLEGITKNKGTEVSGLGSFVKLPDTPEFQDWFYDRNGLTFQTWTHVPNLTDDNAWFNNDASSLYRLVLACENTGSHPQAPARDKAIDSVTYEGSSDYVKGLIVGFTRDELWTNATSNTNNQGPDLNQALNFGFLIAPTLSYDSSSVAFIIKDCGFENNPYGMFIAGSSTTDSGKNLKDISDEFCDLAFTIDYEKDEIRVYLDNEILATSSVTEAFGSNFNVPLKIPTLARANSFEYNSTSVGVIAPDSLKNGPRLNDFFTPWILGGGYTDGMVLTGNFMGSNNVGVTSGLRGYLGSTKFYRKPLSEEELSFNYSIQKKLYKNIVID